MLKRSCCCGTHAPHVEPSCQHIRHANTVERLFVPAANPRHANTNCWLTGCDRVSMKHWPPLDNLCRHMWRSYRDTSWRYRYIRLRLQTHFPKDSPQRCLPSLRSLSLSRRLRLGFGFRFGFRFRAVMRLVGSLI